MHKASLGIRSLVNCVNESGHWQVKRNWKKKKPKQKKQINEILNLNDSLEAAHAGSGRAGHKGWCKEGVNGGDLLGGGAGCWMQSSRAGCRMLAGQDQALLLLWHLPSPVHWCSTARAQALLPFPFITGNPSLHLQRKRRAKLVGSAVTPPDCATKWFFWGEKGKTGKQETCWTCS